MAFVLRPLLLLFPLLLFTGCKSKQTDLFRISVHVQSQGAESGSLTFAENIPGIRRDVYFRTVPEFNQSHINGFYPFREEGSPSWGAVFELDRMGAHRLLNSSTQNVGSYMVIKLDGRTIERLYISQPVSDGLLVVWSGIPETSLPLFEKKMTRLRSQPAGLGTSGTGVNIDASGYDGWDPIRR